MRPYKYGAHGQSALQSVNAAEPPRFTPGVVSSAAQSVPAECLCYGLCRVCVGEGGAERAAEPRTSYAQSSMRQLW